MKLNKEEKEILKSVEKGEWKRIPNFEKEKLRFQKIANATMKKDKRINIRISERDLFELKRIAFEEGLPYQNYLGYSRKVLYKR